jgi:2-polyprenyl-3-methyl-5-hydroxy-6-metoxy-1,4-benzoquinol methylase
MPDKIYLEPMARQYERIFFAIQNEKELNEEVKGKIKVLDIGAGAGGIKDYIGSHISYETLDIAKGSDYRVNLNNGILPISDGVYDMVICTETLEHVFYPNKILKEMKRIGKRNCIYFISMPNEYNFIQRIYYFFGKKTDMDVPFEIVEKHLHIHKPRVKDILNFIEKKFKVEETIYIWQTRNQNIFMKIINLYLSVLAQVMPNLFARLVLVRCRK